MILSSFYNKKENGDILVGLPDGNSDCTKSCIEDCDKCKEYSLPEFSAYEENGKAYSGEGFTRVHRDPEIIAAMQYWMELGYDGLWEELPGNQVYENFDCKNNETDINSKFSQNLWNTPKRGDPRWEDGFQDMDVLVGYPQLQYNSDRTECTVTVFTKTAIELDLTYVFNNEEQESNSKTFDSSFTDILKITVKAKTGEILSLEDVDFVWNSEPLGKTKYDTKGQKGAIVEM